MKKNITFFTSICTLSLFACNGIAANGFSSFNDRPFRAATVSPLETAPFDFPKKAPRPTDAKTLHQQKSAKGGNGSIAFETKKSLSELFDFYKEAMTKTGLQENLSYSGLDETQNHAMNLAFTRWPGGKTVYINAVDLGYKSEKDVRMVSISIQ